MIYLEDTIFSWRPRFIITWFTTAKSFWRWRLLLALGASGARSSPNYLRVGMDSGSATPNDAAEITARLRAHHGDGPSAGSVVYDRATG